MSKVFPLEQGFSALAHWTFQEFLVVGAILCMVGWSATSQPPRTRRQEHPIPSEVNPECL